MRRPLLPVPRSPLTLALLHPPGNKAIVDTVASVFRGVGVERPSLWVTLLRWAMAWIARLAHALGAHPAASWVLRIALALALLAILLRAFLPGVLVRGRRLHLGAPPAARDDWWAVATRLAGEGAFTDAAHALYLALVTAAARRGLVTVHESKTSGDYLREVRRAASAGKRRIGPAELASWRDFVRLYDTVIYGIGTCDGAQYGRLRELATAALGADA